MGADYILAVGMLMIAVGLTRTMSAILATANVRVAVESRQDGD